MEALMIAKGSNNELANFKAMIINQCAMQITT